MRLTDHEIDQIDAGQLSPLARLIIRAVGKRPAIRLFEARGGTAIRKVPIDGSKSEALREIMGLEAAIAFCNAFRGREMDIPKIDAALRQIRNARILDEAQSESLATLARRYDLTRRQVSNIVYGDPSGKPRTDDRQAELFG